MTRHFLYFSANGPTSGKTLSGKEVDLRKAGRMDIAIHSFIQGIFLSNDFREDVVFHFILYGMPDPPKHLEIRVSKELEISKKDIAGLIKRLLYKYQTGKKKEVLPGCFVEKKSLLNVLDELIKNKIEVFILDKKGKPLREAKIPNNCAFLLGDQEGLPKKELKRLKGILKPLSVGNKTYFASQTIVIVNNELDFREI